MKKSEEIKSDLGINEKSWVTMVNVEHSHHIKTDENGDLIFQSDKHPDLKKFNMAMSFKDPFARKYLASYACDTPDIGLARDIFIGLILTIDQVKSKSSYGGDHG